MTANQTHNYDLLLKDITTKIGRPVSVDVVVAIIESFGIRDKDTVEDFGKTNILELATLIFSELNGSTKELKNEKELKELSESKKNKSNLFTHFLLFFKHYFFATSYLLAIVVQLVTIVLYGFALYVFTKFNPQQSTAVVLGIILGMILSGGFIQIIGKEISTYYYSDDFSMVKQITFSMLKKGVLFIIGVLLILFVINLLFLVFPISMMLVTLLYAFLVGTLFLVFAPLHILKSRFIILLSTTVATLVGVYLLLNTPLNIYLIHSLSLSVAIGVTLLFLVLYFWKKKTGKNVKKDYKPGAIVFNNYQYFLYGILLNLYFFIDRILAWSATNISHYFFPIYYEKDYEIGMDLAILFFLLLVSSLEYSGVSFVKKLDALQQNTLLVNETDYISKLRGLYTKSTVLLFVTAIPVLVIVEYFIYSDYGYNSFFSVPLNELNIRVAQLGIFSYFFLCWGLLNALYLITLRQQKVVLKFIAIACVVNFCTGFFLSRLFSYEYSVLGLLAGSIVFVALGLKQNIKVFKNIDYYYYATF